MQIEIFRSLAEAGKATGVAVIIDVFRAFTTEAYIFSKNADRIIPVLNLEDAYRLKKENPEYILAGERGGLKPEGFDFGNGPSEVLDVDFSGKTIIHTTSNGTKGLLGAVNAEVVLAGSFSVASSIIKFIKENNFEKISLVSTAPDAENDNEDILLAYYIRDLLLGEKVDEEEIKNKLSTTSVYNFLIKEAGVPQADIDLCLDFNRFDFIIKKVVENEQMYLVKESV